MNVRSWPNPADASPHHEKRADPRVGIGPFLYPSSAVTNG